jgi:hypothetical protein
MSMPITTARPACGSAQRFPSPATRSQLRPKDCPTTAIAGRSRQVLVTTAHRRDRATRGGLGRWFARQEPRHRTAGEHSEEQGYNSSCGDATWQ